MYVRLVTKVPLSHTFVSLDRISESCLRVIVESLIGLQDKEGIKKGGREEGASENENRCY